MPPGAGQVSDRPSRIPVATRSSSTMTSPRGPLRSNSETNLASIDNSLKSLKSSSASAENLNVSAPSSTTQAMDSSKRKKRSKDSLEGLPPRHPGDSSRGQDRTADEVEVLKLQLEAAKSEVEVLRKNLNDHGMSLLQVRFILLCELIEL